MCGFLLQYNKRKNLSLNKFLSALDLQRHRGPDYQGVFFKTDETALQIHNIKSAPAKTTNSPVSLAFGHQRLAIVDLSPESHQPVVSKNNGNVMLFNGEFYNFSDYVRSKETSKSDTLTLFHLFEENGIESLEKVNGMWGLCYYVAEERQIYIARDRYGKKPVYYYQDEEQFIAGSEIKSIFCLLESQKRQVNPHGLSYYLLGKQTPFLNDGETFYQNIKSVRPGQVLRFDVENFKTAHYCDIGFDDKKYFQGQSLPEEKFIQNLHDDMQEAVKIRIKSEVPVSISASGGVDSTFIAGVAAKNLSLSKNLSLYTCHIVDGNNEVTADLAYARALAKDLDLPLHEVKVEKSNTDDFMRISRLLAKQVELPLNLFLATTPTYLMTRSMAQQGIKVVLDGVGGDEIMGGYPGFTSLFMANAYRKHLGRAYYYFQNWKAFSKPDSSQLLQILKSGVKAALIGNNMISTSEQLFGMFSPYLHSTILDASTKRLMDEYFTRHKITSQTEVQLFEIEKYQLPYYLGTSDQMSMINSVENRSPYLDKNLHKYVYMPEKYKFSKGYNKYALRAAMPSNISDKFKWRTGKMGIGNAFSQNMMTQDKPYECIMDSSFIRSFFNIELLEKHKTAKNYRHVIRPLFSLALLDDIYGLTL